MTMSWVALSTAIRAQRAAMAPSSRLDDPGIDDDPALRSLDHQRMDRHDQPPLRRHEVRLQPFDGQTGLPGGLWQNETGPARDLHLHDLRHLHVTDLPTLHVPALPDDENSRAAARRPVTLAVFSGSRKHQADVAQLVEQPPCKR